MPWLSKEPKKVMGRAMKYRGLLEKLDLYELYSAASIARFARDTNYLDATLSPEQQALALRRIRITFVRLTKNRHFPPEGDGMVCLPKQRPMPAWFGWRWHLAAKGIMFDQTGENHHGANIHKEWR